MNSIRMKKMPVAFTVIVDGDDTPVLHSSQGPSLARKSLRELVVSGGIRTDHLEGDKAVKPDLSGLEDGPHAALPERFEDFQVREDLTELSQKRFRDDQGLVGTRPCVRFRNQVIFAWRPHCLGSFRVDDGKQRYFTFHECTILHKCEAFR